MYMATQFSIFMVNKPGVLAQVLQEFGRQKINIVAMTMMDSVEHGVMRVIFAVTEKGNDVLKKLNMPFNKTDVLCVNINNQAGALGTIVEKMAENHINISYAYCTAGARGGRTTAVLKVANVKKAMKVLTEAGDIRKKKAPVKRQKAKR
jgi:hypothetical protein